MPKASDPTPADLQGSSSFDAQIYEQENVHAVYESIAQHFSSTRYKPWPLIPRFLSTLPPGSVGADLGCGNGKYLSLFSVLSSNEQGKVQEKDDRGVEEPDEDDGLQGGHILSLGMDRSTNLVSLAQHNFLDEARNIKRKGKQRQGSRQEPEMITAHSSWCNEVAVGDALLSNYRTSSLDYALSIATIHHFSTRARRVASIVELIRIIRPIPLSSLKKDQVDGIESPKEKLQSGPSATGRFLVFVWALEQRGESRRKFDEDGTSGGDPLRGGDNDDEKGRENDRRQDLLVPWILKSPSGGDNSATESKGDDNCSDESKDKVHQRYYHVFKAGELEDLVVEASLQFPHLRIKKEIIGWERGNWYGVWQCIDKAR